MIRGEQVQDKNKLTESNEKNKERKSEINKTTHTQKKSREKKYSNFIIIYL